MPSYKVLAHNLNHDIAKSQADEIQRQQVEGERVTLVYIMDGRETHQDCDPEECDACYALILAAHRQELEEIERVMLEVHIYPAFRFLSEDS